MRPPRRGTPPRTARGGAAARGGGPRVPRRPAADKGGGPAGRDATAGARSPVALVEQYRLGDVGARLRVREDSPLVGIRRDAFDPREFGALALVAVTDGTSGEPVRRQKLKAGNLLLVKGGAEETARLAAEMRLAPVGDDDGSMADTLFNRNSGLAEVMVPPRSPLIGTTMMPGMVPESGDLVVLAITRNGEELASAHHGEVVRPQEVVVQAGGQLLLQGSWAPLDAHLKTPEVVVVDSPDLVRRQAAP